MFTLVELLVTLAIVGVLLGIALPAFQNLARGQGVELAARIVGAKLRAARSYAITKREYVAVLFPQSGLPDKYCYAACRGCIVSKASTYDSGAKAYNYTFERWIPGEDWMFLPKATGVVEIDSDIGRDITLNDHEVVDGVKCSDIGSSYNSVDDLHAVIFKPSGKPAKLARYVSVDEGEYSVGAFIRTNPNSEGIDLKVDSYTGRISYGSD